MDATKISELKLFVDQCKSNPSILNDPKLGFFRNYLESLGARLPASESRNHHFDESDDDMEDLGKDYSDVPKPSKSKTGDAEDDIIESDIELDGEVVEPDNDPPQKMGDPSIEVTEESRDAAQMAKAKAMDAISEGKLEEGIAHLTEAITCNPSSAILYATRASFFVKMKKPNAAIRDADAALQINPDSAKGYKSRGMARALLGQWEDAAKDLHIASRLDYDEEIGLVLKKVEPNSRKIEEHRRKYERLRKERGVKTNGREKQNRDAKAKSTHDESKMSEQSSAKESTHDESQMPEQSSEKESSEAMAVLRDGNVVSLHSSNELETKLNAAKVLSRLAILYFTAVWCGPCRFIAPTYSELAQKYPHVVFLKADIDELKDVAAKWNISSVPTFFFIKNGKEVDKIEGADKEGLKKKITLHAGKP